jgi:hypothetical protein
LVGREKTLWRGTFIYLRAFGKQELDSLYIVKMDRIITHLRLSI